MAKRKIKPNWMIILMFIGGLFYLINFVDSLFRSKESEFEFLSFDMGKWPYAIFCLVCGYALMNLAMKWYKEKRNAKSNS
ncbi:hypothetical protein [Roseivirga sp. E12]|uniref:hypothetical protein n=1 Tax=Roseivirga sp. E12 TaxID=2819237 RepID=UPI001ABD0F24|nr:hypothetical protein [Roseivirga sp. E12]MBO3700516.1 hypothetical protein [Roseivirga sp. E12]